MNMSPEFLTESSSSILKIMVTAFCVLFKKSWPTPNLASFTQEPFKNCTFQSLGKCWHWSFFPGTGEERCWEVRMVLKRWKLLDALLCSGQAGIKDLSSELVGVVFLRENHSSNHQTNVICIQPCPDTIPTLLIEAVSTPPWAAAAISWPGLGKRSSRELHCGRCANNLMPFSGQGGLPIYVTCSQVPSVCVGYF